ncbi:MAG: type II toxin-antitoxin system PemK/MazF family toxin [Armatimonadetes bacterium]|nr:type II toxin-antitoxin system PemK/MazF family toxin [Armatimonadota bacterium]
MIVLTRDAVVDLDSLQTLSKATLRERIAPLSRQKMNEVEAAIRFALSLA